MNFKHKSLSVRPLNVQYHLCRLDPDPLLRRVEFSVLHYFALLSLVMKLLRQSRECGDSQRLTSHATERRPEYFGEN